ncbi:DUF3152 domain-containing protein [Demequina oxidasica]|uniref:DUF3152 domain-containing protein n=1 Tax=Demequina oxidasica TaxID=676199 RepID=UPI000781C42B|nr:DUF3152 domain-containing protein [Demequina oxidasica]
MSRRSEGLFAGRGISWRTAVITAVVVALAFGAGIATGWGTSKIPGMYRAANETSPSPTPTPTPSPSVEVSVPPLEPIDRELTEDDYDAGVFSLDYTLHGEETFTAAPGEDPVPDNGIPVRLVRIDVEDGIDIDAAKFGTYVMNILNDPRGWGSGDRMQFVLTQGVPDVRIVMASPYTAAALCPNPHATGQGASATREPTTDNGEDSTPTADATCADRGTAAISQYDWIAGLPGYGDDIVGARDFLITHDTGHILGEAEGECVRGSALVMADQREPMEDCTTNPWAFPDSAVPADDPSPAPSPSS